MEKKHGLDFPILFDEDNKTGKAYGLVFEFPDDLKEVYSGFDLDVPKHNGSDVWELPMPARYVIGRDGHVVNAVVHPDYKKRPEPEDTLKIVEGL